MSVKDVTILRKEGKIKEAYDLARGELAEDPNDWTRMSLFWVLRDLAIKQFLPDNKINETRRCLEQMERFLPNMVDNNGAGEIACQYLRKLLLPNANEIKHFLDLSKNQPDDAYRESVELWGRNAGQLCDGLHEDFGWIVYRYMRANNNQLTSFQIRCLLRDYMQLKNKRPSLLHSMVLNYALNFSKDHTDFSFFEIFYSMGCKES